jgi:hypothetical protein
MPEVGSATGQTGQRAPATVAYGNRGNLSSIACRWQKTAYCSNSPLRHFVFFGL